MKYVSLFVLAAGLMPAANYSIDSAHSAAQFKVRHLMVSNVRGDFSKLNGKLEFDSGNLGASKVEATIDVATVTSSACKWARSVIGKVPARKARRT